MKFLLLDYQVSFFGVFFSKVMSKACNAIKIIEYKQLENCKM